MLQAIRSRAGSLVVKILFAVLIVAFGFWGIGSWLNDSAVDSTIATVGNDKVRAEQLTSAVRTQVQTLKQTYGETFDIEEAKKLGIVADQLDQLIADSLITQEVGRMRLAIGNDAVRTMILNDPVFHDAGGQFDRLRYQQVLNNNRMSEAQYEASVRNQLVRGALSDAVAGGVAAPKPLVDAFYRMLAEKRVADTVMIPFASATDIGEPGEQDLADFHDQHSELFRAPELRSFQVASLTLDDLAKAITFSDDELKDEYQRRLDDFKTPDRRHVEQILVRDQATADQAETALKGGQAFAAVAKDVAKMASGPIDLGLVSAEALGEPKLSDAAFKLEKDGISDPVQTDFGWHILHVTEIQPAKTETFEEAKPKIASELAHDAADTQIGKVMNKVDDALARGDDLDKVAADLQLNVAKPADVDENGHAVNGSAAALPSSSADILHTAFNTEAGQVSNVAETQDGGFYVVRVDKVTPSVVRPLAEVRDQVLAAWQQQQRIDRITKTAKEIVDAVNGGKPLKEIAAQHSLTVTTTPQIERGRETGGLPPPAITGLFRAKPHQAVQGLSNDGVYVAELTEVIAADPATDKPRVDAMSAQIRQQIQTDLFAEYTGALHQYFPVVIDQSRVDKVF
ncbi:MAG TPA: peptidyl-prolyl cis-trans isomerase [Stellaceae bacterium]|nr:peptidyl-prolyl cis-trans isomerase [Stellaceae bacterium]